MSRPADNDFAEARQAAFAAVFEEYNSKYGAEFDLAWFFDTDPTLDGRFLEDLARRLEGRSVREIGRALATTHPTGWDDGERAAWLGALGSWAIRPLAARDRAALVGTAHVLGLDGRAKQWGLTW